MVRSRPPREEAAMLVRRSRHRRRRQGLRRNFASILALSAVCATLTFAGATRGPSAVAQEPSALQVPAADASPVRQVVLRCSPQQTDVNHATLPEVMAAVGVSQPVAQRIVASRPYNDPSDITVVPGVGPGTPVKWDKLCVTPVTPAVGELVPAISAE